LIPDDPDMMMNKGSQEKRKFPRHKVLKAAHLEMFDGSFPVTVVELSVEGLRLHSATAIPPETHVAVRFNVGREVVFHGQVMWVADRLTTDGQLYRMGIYTDAVLDKGVELINLEEREIMVNETIILMADEASLY
jgi:PilZ domain-containing protein